MQVDKGNNERHKSGEVKLSLYAENIIMDLESSEDSMAKSNQVMNKVAEGYKRMYKEKNPFKKKVKYLRINLTWNM